MVFSRQARARLLRRRARWMGTRRIAPLPQRTSALRGMVANRQNVSSTSWAGGRWAPRYRTMGSATTRARCSAWACSRLAPPASARTCVSLGTPRVGIHRAGTASVTGSCFSRTLMAQPAQEHPGQARATRVCSSPGQRHAQRHGRALAVPPPGDRSSTPQDLSAGTPPTLPSASPLTTTRKPPPYAACVTSVPVCRVCSRLHHEG